MMKPSSKFDIVVYGATGFTGQLVAEYLAAHYTGNERSEMGDGRTQPGQARFGARCDRRAGRHGLDPGRRRRSRFAEGHDRPDQIGALDRRPVSALWLRTGRGLRGIGHRLSRSLRRAGLDAADDRRASRPTAQSSGARIVFSCGFDSLPFELGVFFCQETAKKVFGAPVSRVKGRVRDMTGTFSGGTAASIKATLRGRRERSQPGGACCKNPFVLTPGFEGPKQPPGNKPVFDEDLDCLDRAVCDGDHQHPQRASLQHADGLSLRQGLRLRRDGADRSGREGRSQRQARRRRQHARGRAAADRSRARGRRKKNARTASTICCLSGSRPTDARFASRCAAIAIPAMDRPRK